MDSGDPAKYHILEKFLLTVKCSHDNYFWNVGPYERLRLILPDISHYECDCCSSCAAAQWVSTQSFRLSPGFYTVLVKPVTERFSPDPLLIAQVSIISFFLDISVNIEQRLVINNVLFCNLRILFFFTGSSRPVFLLMPSLVWQSGSWLLCCEPRERDKTFSVSPVTSQNRSVTNTVTIRK